MSRSRYFPFHVCRSRVSPNRMYSTNDAKFTKSCLRCRTSVLCSLTSKHVNVSTSQMSNTAVLPQWLRVFTGHIYSVCDWRQYNNKLALVHLTIFFSVIHLDLSPPVSITYKLMYSISSFSSYRLLLRRNWNWPTFVIRGAGAFLLVNTTHKVQIKLVLRQSD